MKYRFITPPFAISILSLLALLTFYPTLRVGFMIDDPFLLEAVQSHPGYGMESLRGDFTRNIHNQTSSFYYRPILSLLVRAEYGLWGQHALGYHLVSLVFHVINTLLLFLLARMLGFAPLTALLAAAQFAVHPLIVDDFLAATGGESMANSFFLGSLVALLSGRNVLGMILAVPALFAKESGIILPVALTGLLLYLGRFRKEYWKALALLPLCAAYLWLRHLVVENPPGVNLLTTSVFLIKAFPKICVTYIGGILAPLQMETWPPMLPLSRLWPLYLIGWTGVLLWASRRRNILLCLGWFLIMMAPRIPAIMVNNVLMDKWATMSSFGLFLLISLLLTPILKEDYSRGLRLAASGVFTILLLGWMTIAHQNVMVRGSDEKNYRYTIRNGPREFANFRLGVILMRTGRAQEAVPVLDALLKLVPDHPDYQNAFALALWHSGETARAKQLMDTLARQFPANASIQANAHEMQLRDRHPVID